MKSYRLLLIVLPLVGLTACRHQILSCRVIPVPPADSRSDQMQLPLNSDSKAGLSRSLTYGLNRRNEADGVATIANAAAQYGGLLDLLSAPNTPSLQDLQGPAFKKWFANGLATQVVDARDTGTPAVDQTPVAANDGAYWWIFYRNGNQLTAVMVTKINACQTLVEAKR